MNVGTKVVVVAREGEKAAEVTAALPTEPDGVVHFTCQHQWDGYVIYGHMGSLNGKFGGDLDGLVSRLEMLAKSELEKETLGRPKKPLNSHTNGECWVEPGPEGTDVCADCARHGAPE